MTTLDNENVLQMMRARIEKKLVVYAKQMPEGEFMNLHNNQVESCSAIVMLATGAICPIFRKYPSCLNELNIYEEGESRIQMTLSILSFAGNIYPKKTLAETVEAYNSELMETVEKIPTFGRFAIVGYHSFDPEW